MGVLLSKPILNGQVPSAIGWVATLHVVVATEDTGELAVNMGTTPEGQDPPTELSVLIATFEDELPGDHLEL
jgi:hypothetical protein